MKFFTKALFTLFLFAGLFSSQEAKACHGLALVNYNFVVGATGVTLNGSSGSPTCGCGPYWMQTEVACTAAGVSGVPTAAIQATLAAGNPYNTYPWYNSLLNVPNYTLGAGWPDQCVVEPYNSVFVPFAGLCAGQTYFFASREWLGGSNSAGPWTAVNQFTVPGVLTPLIASITAPTTICAGQCVNLSVFGISGGCGAVTVNWSSGLGTGLGPKVVCPAVTTVYSATATSGPSCSNTVRSTTVTVVPIPSAAFTSAPAAQCLNGNLFTFTNTGTTVGTTNTWDFGDGSGTSTLNPVTHTYATAGTFVVTHTVSIGSCQAVLSQNVTVYPQPNVPTFAPVNPNCGLSNGSVVVTATGGLAPYSYSLNGGGNQPSTSFTGLAAGTYTVLVTDARGCTRQGTFTLTNQPGPTALVTTPSNTGCGSSTGSIVVGATTGGTAPYVYSLNAPVGPFANPPSTFNGLAAGTYTVYVRDNNGCIFPQPVVIGTATGPTAINATTVPAGCTVPNGSLNITGTVGGTATYSYSVNGGASTTATNYTGLATGPYTITVTDVNACTYNQIYNVGQLTGPNSLTLTPTPAACGASNGSINSFGGGGTPAYTFSINNGVSFQPSGTFPGLPPATYTIIVRDVNGCTFQSTVVVPAAPAPTLAVTLNTPVSCNGGNNGGLTVTPTGGNPTFSYTLTPGGTTSLTGIFTGLSAGAYTVNLSDNFGCTAVATGTVIQPALLTGALTASTNVACYNGTTGTATVAGAGGTPGYTYSLNGAPFVPSGAFIGLAAGTFTITVRDVNGCTTPVPFVITQPTALTIALSTTGANCTSANGTATAVIAGGTGAITYAWTPSGGAGATSTGVVAGSYTMTANDANGCPITGVATIPLVPGGVASIPTVQNVLCNGAANGQLTASITGTSATSYTYLWAPSGGSAATTTNIGPGNYTVTITDNFGCVSTATATITQPAVLNFTLPHTNVSCNGGANGSLLATGVTGGTPAYVYSWTPAVAGNSPNAAGLGIGTYTCTVTDANGCTRVLTKTITQPTVLTLATTIVNTNCNQANGSITCTGGGGAGTYQYQLNAGVFGSGNVFNGLSAGTYTITVKDANQCTTPFPVTILNNAGPVAALQTQVNVTCFGLCNGSATTNISGGTAPYSYLWTNGQTTPNATNLCVGITSFTVTDAAGCKSSIGVTITQPTDLVINTVGTNPLCNGGNTGTGTVAVSGGTPNYTISWSTVPIQTTVVANNLPAGSYNVIVTDANGCQKTSSVNLVNPLAMIANVTAQNVKCFGTCTGTATASAVNANGAVSYAWTTVPVQASQTAGGLCIGQYSVTITDANNCVANAAINITQPTQLVASIPTSGNVSCFGACNGWALGNAAGGTPPYVFSWTSGPPGANATNLCAGAYTLTLTDSVACQTSSVVNITQPPALVVTATSTSVTCNAACNGTATASFNGGTAPYTFLWTPSLAQTPNATSLCAGTHQVLMIDNMGCRDSVSVTFTEPSPITVTTSVVNSTCLLSNGSANCSVSGGTAPFTYSWSNGPINPFNPGIPAGGYIITVTDGNNCTQQAVANVNDLLGPTILNLAQTNVTCFGLNDGTATIQVTPGANPLLSTIWSAGNSVAPFTTATNLPPGAIIVTVTDIAGCVASSSFILTTPPGMVSAISNVAHIPCFGLCNGSATMLVNGGTSTYTYLWTSGQVTPSVTLAFCAGTYSCTVTDLNGCQSISAVTITEPPALQLNNTPGAVNVTCFGAQNGSINVSVSGGTPFYNYVWAPINANSPIITTLGPGSYTLNVSDQNACTLPTTVYTITEPTPIALTTATVSSTCSLSNGSATVSASGGTPLPGNPAYLFLWNNAGTSTTPTANGLPAATYNCVVTDANGCTANISSVITDIPGPVFATMVFTDATCNAFLNGTAGVTATGGTAPIVYSWTNSSSANVGSTANLTGAVAGIYNVNVQDANGCFFNQTVTISQPNLLTIAVSQGDTVCYFQTNPVVNVFGAAGGGTAPYTYSWTLNGAPIATNPVAPGTQSVSSVGIPGGFTTSTYSVSVTDANGCPAAGGQITATVRPAITAVSVPVAGCDNDLATVSTTPGSGSGGPYTVSWQGAGTGTSLNITVNYNNPDSVYPIYFTVDDGCSQTHSDSVMVTSHPLPNILFIPDPRMGCDPLDVSFTSISNISGTTFDWNYGDGGSTTNNPAPTHVFIGAGTYTITATGTTPFGCINTFSDFVTVIPKPDAEFSFTPSSTSILYPLIEFTNLSQGAVSYAWNFGDPNTTTNTSTTTHPSHNYEIAGTYVIQLIVSNSDGCIDTTEHTLVVDPDFVIYVPNAFSPNGDNINDLFFPKGMGIDETRFKMYIFNRWGEQIWVSETWGKGWDGTSKGAAEIVQEDVYVWKIQCYDMVKNEKHNLVGHVTVVK